MDGANFILSQFQFMHCIQDTAIYFTRVEPYVCVCTLKYIIFAVLTYKIVYGNTDEITCLFTSPLWKHMIQPSLPNSIAISPVRLYSTLELMLISNGCSCTKNQNMKKRTTPRHISQVMLYWKNRI